jgi:hypothetical protein
MKQWHKPAVSSYREDDLARIMSAKAQTAGGSHSAHGDGTGHSQHTNHAAPGPQANPELD